MSRLAQAPLVLAALLFLSFPTVVGAANILMALFLIAFILAGNYRER